MSERKSVTREDVRQALFRQESHTCDSEFVVCSRAIFDALPATPPASETVEAASEPVVDDRTFMENVREALGNGYEHVCAYCGIGVAHDDMDMHKRGCPEWKDWR